MYVAIIHTTGHLPDSADPMPTFDTAQEAWQYLSDKYQRDGETAYQPVDPNDPEGPRQLTATALELERHTYPGNAKTGTVYGPFELTYSVEFAEDDRG